MSGAGARRLVASLFAVLLATSVAAGEAVPVELRVRSLPRTSTVVTIRLTPDVALDDRTPGALPPEPGKGSATRGNTFSDEIALHFPGVALAREAIIDVGDEFVSEARLAPDGDGVTLRVFVRRPVSYAATRPSPLGEVTLTVTPRKSPDDKAGKAAKGDDTADAQVAVDAESIEYDQEGDVVVAKGNVTLTRGAVTLRADELRYDRTQQVADAKGHVVLADPEATVTGDVAHFRLDDETGWVENAGGQFTTTQYRVEADRVEKECGPVYDVASGRFTTCECGGLEKPSWSLGGKRTHVTLDGFGTLRGAVFRVKDVPALWVPFLAFPANTGRATGFLMPRLGISKRRGFQYEQPFYWAIDKSSDATVAIDVETEARIGAIGEYRYVLSKTTRGAFTGAYFNEAIRGTAQGVNVGDPTDIPEDRFAFTGRHKQRLLGGRAYVDMFAVSDDLFLREINNFADTVSSSLNVRSTRFTKSEAGWINRWNGGFAHLESRYYQDLIEPQKLVVERLPQMVAQQEWSLLGGHVIARLPGRFAYFHREKGYAGARADLAPELSFPFRLGSVVNGSLTGKFRETIYGLTDTRQVANVVLQPGEPEISPVPRLRRSEKLQHLDDQRTRETGEIRARVGTDIARVFDFPYLGFEKLRHSIEPELQYLWVPDTDIGGATRALRPCRRKPDDSLADGESPGFNCGFNLFSQGVLFDEIDAIRHRNFASWGLTTRVFARAATRAERAERRAADEAALEDDLDDEDVPVDADALPSGFSAAGLPLPAVGGSARRPKLRTPGAADAVPGPGRADDDDDAYPESRELLRASVLHGYDFSRPIDGPSRASAIDVALRLTPTTYAGLSYHGTVSLEENEVLTQAVGGFIREPWWRPAPRSLQRPSSVGVSYRFTTSAANRGVDPFTPEGRQFANGEVEQIDWSAYLRISDFAGLSFSSRYNLLEQEFFEQNYGIRLMSRCNCWALDVGYTDRIDIDDTGVRVQLTLVGLGSFGSGGQNGSYAGLNALGGVGTRRPTALGGGF